MTSSVSATGVSAATLASRLISRTVRIRRSTPKFAPARAGCCTSALYTKAHPRARTWGLGAVKMGLAETRRLVVVVRGEGMNRRPSGFQGTELRHAEQARRRAVR